MGSRRSIHSSAQCSAVQIFIDVTVDHCFVFFCFEPLKFVIKRLLQLTIWFCFCSSCFFNLRFNPLSVDAVDESSFKYLSNLQVLDTGAGNPDLPIQKEEIEEEQD